MQNLWRLVKNDRPILNRLWDNVTDPLYFQTPLPYCLSLVSFRRHSPVSKSSKNWTTVKVFWPRYLGEGRPRLFYGRLLVRFAVHRLAKFELECRIYRAWSQPNGIRIRSAVFPQCTEQTDRPTDRSFTGKFDDYRPLRIVEASERKYGWESGTKWKESILRHAVKRDVIHKTGSIKRSATPPDEDPATATGDLHKNFVPICQAVPEIGYARGQTDTRTDRCRDRRLGHNTPRP